MDSEYIEKLELWATMAAQELQDICDEAQAAPDIPLPKWIRAEKYEERRFLLSVADIFELEKVETGVKDDPPKV